MNILLINHYAGSPEMGMEFRPYYFAREWVAMGHKVDIIAADYSHLRRKNPQIEKDFQTEVIDGINYHWIKTNTYEGNGVKRAVTMAQFVGKLWFNSKKILREMEPDVVICSSTYPIDTFVGQRIRRLSGKKVKLVHEIHDMWPATLTEIGGMSKWNPFVIAMQIGENSFCKNSDLVVSLLPHAEEYLLEHGLAEGHFVCIPNGVVEKEWETPEPIPQTHRQTFDVLSEKGKFVVGYFGGHALSNALDVLLDIAHLIEDSAVHFVLVGDGIEKERLIKRSREMGLNNISFLDSIPKKAIPSLCKEFDCIYMGEEDNVLARFGVCLNKMFDSMRAGKPVIYALNGPETYISQYNCGIEIKGGDVEGGVKAILTLKNMTVQERKKLGANGVNAAKENFLYNKLAKTFEIWMEKR